MTILMTIEIEVEADGDFYSGTPHTRSTECPMGYPGDPPDIKNLKVTINKSNRSIDITDALSSSVKEEIENVLIEEYQNSGEVA